MANNGRASQFAFGIFDRGTDRTGIAPLEMVCAGLAGLWIVAVGGMLLAVGARSGAGEPLFFVLAPVAIFVPPALLWVGAMGARSARLLRAEADRLEAALDALRQSHVTQQHSAGMDVRAPAAAPAQRPVRTPTPSPPPAASGRRKPSASPAGDAGDAQPSLALGPQAEPQETPLSTGDFLRALDFPETSDDADGVRALHRALAHRNAARLLRSAQDVLTLLGEAGLYMDDLAPDPAGPDAWRRFAGRERGSQIPSLGRLDDPAALEAAADLMRADPIFRDAAHHFLRRFDAMLADFAPDARDDELADLAETRTARAFILLGLGTGTFD